jgi:hypothetical protein
MTAGTFVSGELTNQGISRLSSKITNAIKPRKMYNIFRNSFDLRVFFISQIYQMPISFTISGLFPRPGMK